MSAKKDISYLGKDFKSIRKNLIDFTKQYFPDTYNDFSEGSSGMLLIELASYVGDVLSYYSDTNLKESLLTQATEQTNIMDLIRSLGYQPKNITPAHVTLDVYQLLPASGSGTNVTPDFNYALYINKNLIVKQSDGPAVFRTLDAVDFRQQSSLSTNDVSVYQSDPVTKQPTYFLVKKQVQAVSGTIKTKTFTFGSAIPYDKITLSESDIIEILSVTDSDGDTWYQVPYLAQDTVFETVPNLLENDPVLSAYRSSSPSLLKMKRTAKRFITRLRSDNLLEIQFGAGLSDDHDTTLIPNPTNVGSGLANSSQQFNDDIDPSNFLYTKTYGSAPTNTTLTVTYTVGSGLADNVSAGKLTSIQNITYSDDPNSTNTNSIVNFIKSTVVVNNTIPARGANLPETITNIKNNALAYFATQNRIVTRDDYIIRAYAMPSKFGSVAKAYIIADDQISQENYKQSRIANPTALNMYVLGFNDSKQLTELNTAIKENLKTYLNYYRMLTDAVNIKNAFIINIGVEFEISVLSNYNSNEILLKCINELKKYFNIDNWQINQPIIKSEIVNLLGNIRGVQNIINVKFNNKYDTVLNYSGNVYDLASATRNGIIYPSLDPSIFELKFPDQDILGRVVSY